MNLVQKDVEQIVPIVLARAGFEKRLVEDDKARQSSRNCLFRMSIH